MNKYLLFLFFWLTTFFTNAQTAGGSEPVETASLFYSEGKIYVVLSVVGIIFASIVLFLVYLERKLNRIEKNLRQK